MYFTGYIILGLCLQVDRGGGQPGDFLLECGEFVLSR